MFGDRTASLFRSGFYLPQVLPVAVTGIVWGWILHPSYGALNRILDSIGLERGNAPIGIVVREGHAPGNNVCIEIAMQKRALYTVA